MKKLACLGLFGVFVLSGCAAKEPRPTEYLTGATLWFQTSGEARALQYQAYQMAQRVLADELKARRGGKPPAVVLDVDETVLDNGPYQGRIVMTGEGYPNHWAEWIRAARAEPIAGTLEFLKFADQKGVRIFYVTNRKQQYCADTAKNLKEKGFPQVTGESLVCRTAESGKEARRSRIAEKHRIVLLVGDNLNDFSDVFEKKDLTARLKAVDENRKRFGTTFIMLPNPMYGDWEGAVYGYDFTLPESRKDQLRRDSLTSF